MIITTADHEQIQTRNVGRHLNGMEGSRGSITPGGTFL